MNRLAAYRPFLLLMGMFAMPLQAADHNDCDGDDKTVTASTIVNTEDIRTFVRCAHAYVMENGEDEAKRAFNEDKRWRSGQFYVFVYDLPAAGEDTINFVGQDQSYIDVPFGPFIDGFGNDYWFESRRIVTNFGEGWVYYSFTNPETGSDATKASYLMSIDWKGTPASDRLRHLPARFPRCLRPDGRQCRGPGGGAEPGPLARVRALRLLRGG